MKKLKHSESRKITVRVPVNLLARAQFASKAGITDTVRKALEAFAAESAYEELRRLRGKVKFSIDLKELREDKDLSQFYRSKPVVRRDA